MGRVILILIEDEDYAWDVLVAASESSGVSRAIMVDTDHPVVKELFN